MVSWPSPRDNAAREMDLGVSPASLGKRGHFRAECPNI